MSNKNSRDKNMSPFLIWLCLTGIGYLAYKYPISLVAGIILIGFVYIRNK